MGLFSSSSKNKSDAAEPAYQSRAEEESNAMRSRGGEGKERKERKSRPASRAADTAVLPEKKRARRRLVGAIALVIAVVIGLPMVLDSEPKPLADDIAIQIPSKDKPGAAPAATTAPYVEPASSAPAGAALDQKEEVIEATKAGAVPAAVPAAAVATVATAAVIAAGENDKVAKAPAAAAQKPEAKAEPKAAAAVPSIASAKAAAPAVDEAARAQAILNGKADVKPAAKGDAKVDAKTEVKTETKAAPAKPTDGKSDKIVLQVAALATQEKINEVLGKLKDAGITPFTQKVATASGERTQIRIHVTGKDEADKLRAKLVKMGFAGAFVVP